MPSAAPPDLPWSSEAAADRAAVISPGAAAPSVQASAAKLAPLLYRDLRRIARHARWQMAGGMTLQTTALVHEAYLKLHGDAAFNDRQHFLCAAALAMRHILVSFARDSVAAKRGGGAVVISIDDAPDIAMPDDSALLAVNDALDALQALSPRLAQVVECRFFAGYTEEETAAALGLTDRTVRRDWVKARAWLRCALAAEGA
jgi:RNA polymerase sigma factor (TIGR02999 family)